MPTDTKEEEQLQKNEQILFKWFQMFNNVYTASKEQSLDKEKSMKDLLDKELKNLSEISDSDENEYDETEINNLHGVSTKIIEKVITDLTINVEKDVESDL